MSGDGRRAGDEAAEEGVGCQSEEAYPWLGLGR